jgi:acyl-CoA thioesterase-2
VREDAKGGQPHPAWVPTLFTWSELESALDVQVPPSASTTELVNLPTGHGGILGAQMLGQMVALSESCIADKLVRTVSMRFLRPSLWREPLVVGIDRISDGRRFAALSVDFRQGDALIARGDVMLAHSISASPGSPNRQATGLPRARSSTRALWPWKVKTPVVPRSEEVDLWARVPGQPLSGRLSRALIAFATESLTVPLAIDLRGRRRDGGMISQAVLFHSVTFHRAFDAATWHRHRARLLTDDGAAVTGQGEVFNAVGGLLATTETVAVLA